MPGCATHQVRGCHTWAVNDGPFAANHTVVLLRGGWMTVMADVVPVDSRLRWREDDGA